MPGNSDDDLREGIGQFVERFSSTHKVRLGNDPYPQIQTLDQLPVVHGLHQILQNLINPPKNSKNQSYGSFSNHGISQMDCNLSNVDEHIGIGSFGSKQSDFGEGSEKLIIPN